MNGGSSLPAPPSREVEIWSATRTLAMHLRGGQCAMCTPDGCRLKTWAESIRRQAARDGLHVPELEPVPPRDGQDGFNPPLPPP